MVLYDFNIQRYLENNRHLLAINNYYRITKKINKKTIQKETKIPHASYRRAEINDFVDHPDMLFKVANYFNVPTDIDREFIDELNDDFNKLYTYYYLDDKKQMEEAFNKIEAKKPQLEKTAFITIYHFAKLVYYIGSEKRVKVDKISLSLNILEGFEEDLLDEFKFLLDLYRYSYYSLIHDEANSIKYAQIVYVAVNEYPELVPIVLYQMSVNYYLINDYANCIFYSLEALPLLINNLNFKRALYCNMNMAICFERLENAVKSKEILNKIQLYLTSNYDERIDYLTNLTLANCYVTEKDYKSAIPIFDKLESTRKIKGENSLMLLYCYYKTDAYAEFNQLRDMLLEEYDKKNLYVGYYHLVILMDALDSKNKTLIRNKFKIAKEHFQFIGDAKIADLINKEMIDKRIIKKPVASFSPKINSSF